MNPNRPDPLSAVGLLILRVGTGGFMLTHGWGKLQMVLDGKLSEFPDPIGIGGPASLLMVTFAEFVCAGLIVIGLLTRLAAIPPVIAMAVAAFVVHSADPWTMQTAAERFFAGESQFPAAKQGALMFLIPFLALVFTGPGAFSVDRLIWRRRSGAAARIERSDGK